MDVVTGIGNNLGFITRQWWDVINLSIIGLLIIAIIIAIVSKDKVRTKALNVLFITFIPLIGSLYFFGRLLFNNLKNKQSIADICNG